MGQKRSIKEILEALRKEGDLGNRYADELEEAVNREFKEFASELKAQIFLFLGKENGNSNESEEE